MFNSPKIYLYLLSFTIFAVCYNLLIYFMLHFVLNYLYIYVGVYTSLLLYLPIQGIYFYTQTVNLSTVYI